ncbi:hypothetical protein EON65_39190 [archaeon]|nr:MAG: hypothetical protein EON65_39190 [archaeon]
MDIQTYLGFFKKSLRQKSTTVCPTPVILSSLKWYRRRTFGASSVCSMSRFSSVICMCDLIERR